MLPCFAVIHFFGHRYKADDFWQCCGISKYTAVQFMLQIIWYMFISASFCHLLKTFLFAASSKQTSTGKTDVLQFYISYTSAHWHTQYTKQVATIMTSKNPAKRDSIQCLFRARHDNLLPAVLRAHLPATSISSEVRQGGHSPAHHLGANRPLRFPDRTPP